MKGDREARSILIRDSNRVVATAVINNPRITDQEVENIAAMRTVADEVLRLIAANRAWARSYSIIHNLVRNPRTPIPTVISTLPRIRTKDLHEPHTKSQCFRSSSSSGDASYRKPDQAPNILALDLLKCYRSFAKSLRMSLTCHGYYV